LVVVVAEPAEALSGAVSPSQVKWKTEPGAHEYRAAADYLELLVSSAEAARLVRAFRRATTVRKKAKDIARASGLPILPPRDPHVAADLRKVRAGHALAPLLLVRGNLAGGVPLVIADGYHRLCASYNVDEDVEVSCRIITAGSGAARR
jgi:hypothetical protein